MPYASDPAEAKNGPATRNLFPLFFPLSPFFCLLTFSSITEARLLCIFGQTVSNHTFTKLIYSPEQLALSQVCSVDSGVTFDLKARKPLCCQISLKN